MPNLPEFLPRHGIVRVDGLPSRTDKLPPGPAGNQKRHGERLPHVHGNRAVIERAVRLPDGLAVGSVESDHVLNIATVDIHDQQVSQRGTGNCWARPRIHGRSSDRAASRRWIPWWNPDKPCRRCRNARRPARARSPASVWRRYSPQRSAAAARHQKREYRGRSSLFPDPRRRQTACAPPSSQSSSRSDFRR